MRRTILQALLPFLVCAVGCTLTKDADGDPAATGGTAVANAATEIRHAETRPGRAYEGAPPVVAHPLSLGAECSECHMDGSDGFDDPDMPPITPHPELTNCRMCHVFQRTKETYAENGFEPVRYELGQRLHDQAPPLIPHPLTMRERCVVCHNQLSWREGMAPAHSESWNCRMCHLPAHSDAPGPRPGSPPLPQGEDED